MANFEDGPNAGSNFTVTENKLIMALKESISVKVETPEALCHGDDKSRSNSKRFCKTSGSNQ